MQLYVSDFVGDTLHLSTEQIGAYMLILMAMWNAGGRLPDDDTKLARIVRMSVKKWRAIADDLMPFLDRPEGQISAPVFRKWISDERRLLGRKPIPTSVRSQVFARDGQLCKHCGSSEGPFHIDHVHPVALGGGDELENLVVACAECNMSKGAKLLEEWMIQ